MSLNTNDTGRANIVHLKMLPHTKDNDTCTIAMVIPYAFSRKKTRSGRVTLKFTFLAEVVVLSHMLQLVAHDLSLF